MKKKTIITISIVILVIAAAIGGYKYYEYNYVELVADYYKTSVTMPIVKTGLYGDKQLSKPKFSFERMPDFRSDSNAVVYLRKDLQSTKKFYSDTYSQLLKEHPKDEMKQFTLLAKKEAASEKLQELDNSIYTVIAFYHPRSYDNEDVIKVIQKYGMDLTKLTEFCEKHNLKAYFYQVNI